MTLDRFLNMIKVVGCLIVVVVGGFVGGVAMAASIDQDRRLPRWRSVAATVPAGAILIAIGSVSPSASAMTGIMMWGVLWLFLAAELETGLAYLIANRSGLTKVSFRDEAVAGACLALPVAALLSHSHPVAALGVVLVGALRGDATRMLVEWQDWSASYGTPLAQGMWSLGFIPTLGLIYALGV